MKHSDTISIIGAGLAGCEAAYQIAKRGIPVTLYEAKPLQMSAAHKSADFAELVCSNSLKSLDPYTAHGLLKAEMRLLDSLILRCAEASRIPAGGALAVDRELFAKTVTQAIQENPNIRVVCETVDSVPPDGITVIATGPLTVGRLADELDEKFEGNLSFYDAAAPIVSCESIDRENAFFASRYGKSGDRSQGLGAGEDAAGDYLNCPLTESEYYAFIDALVKAERAPLKEFDIIKPNPPPAARHSLYFEGCMPIEALAARGRDTLRFGPLKPVGIADPRTGKRPFAVVQLRKENAAGEMFNLVGFQTNLKFAEQRRVFSIIPALKNAEFLRYGVMHRNTFVNAPNILNRRFQVKSAPRIFIAGQLSGVEGYVESAASGLIAGIYAATETKNEKRITNNDRLPDVTMLGSLSRYLTTPNPDFQPMNSNFGLLPPLDIRDKSLRRKAFSERSLDALKSFIDAT